jgi:hypothetical protein
MGTTVNNALNINDERECEIVKKLDAFVNEKEEKNISDLIKGVEAWDDSFSRIEKSYAIYLLGEAVERERNKEDAK